MTSLNSIVAKGDKKAEILIYDEIGDSWFSDGVTAKGFAEQLKALGDIDAIDVRINSPGGSVFQGLVIYNTLAAHKAKVNVHIDGAAISIASIIAMAGDTISIAENALMMIHKPSAVAFGNDDDMLAMAGTLERLGVNLRDIYASRSGQPAEEMMAAMKAETWYTAAEAKAKGLVTAITANKSIAARFDAKKFDKAPEWAATRLREITNFTPEGKKDMPPTPTPVPAPKAQDPAPAPSPVTPPAPEPTPAPVTPPADPTALANAAVTAERERITKIVALCTQANHPELGATYSEDPKMSVADCQAKLFEVLCRDRKPIGEGDGKPPTPPVADENTKYKNEFNAMKADYIKAGFTEESYVAMRRRDDGLDSLVVGSAVKAA